MSKLATVLLAAAACGGSHSTSSSSPTSTSPASNLVGTWVSVSGETRPGPQGPLYIKRTFRFTPTGSDNEILFFADDTYAKQTMRFEFGGAYKILGPSPKVPGATMANFPIERLAITPLDEGTVGFLSSLPAGACGASWKLGQKQDLPGGCAAFHIETGVTTEHDIFKVENDHLYFGARPADGSLLDTEDKRPTSWQVPLVREK